MFVEVERKGGESNSQGTLLYSTAFQAAAVTDRLALPRLKPSHRSLTDLSMKVLSVRSLLRTLRKGGESNSQGTFLRSTG